MNSLELPDTHETREGWSGAGRVRKQRFHYRDLAESKHLIWVGAGGQINEDTLEVTEGVLPNNVWEKTLWYCPRCTRGYQWRTYHALSQKNTKCLCRTNMCLQEEHYISDAAAIGVAWVGKRLPANTKEKTQWIGKDGVLFEASKHDLFSFGRPPAKKFRSKVVWAE